MLGGDIKMLRHEVVTLSARYIHVQMHQTTDNRQTHTHHCGHTDWCSIEAVKQTTGRMVLRHQPEFNPQTDICIQTEHSANTWTE